MHVKCMWQAGNETILDHKVTLFEMSGLNTFNWIYRKTLMRMSNSDGAITYNNYVGLANYGNQIKFYALPVI